jgi:hypothetical protein
VLEDLPRAYTSDRNIKNKFVVPLFVFWLHNVDLCDLKVDLQEKLI